jgi:hypothetical protein
VSERPIDAATLAEALDWARWLDERPAGHIEFSPNERRIIALAREVDRRAPRPPGSTP